MEQEIVEGKKKDSRITMIITTIMPWLGGDIFSLPLQVFLCNPRPAFFVTSPPYVDLQTFL